MSGPADLRLREVREAADAIRERADPEANVIFGASFNEARGEDVLITLIATGLSRHESIAAPAVEAGSTDGRPPAFEPAPTVDPPPAVESARAVESPPAVESAPTVEPARAVESTLASTPVAAPKPLAKRSARMSKVASSGESNPAPRAAHPTSVRGRPRCSQPGLGCDRGPWTKTDLDVPSFLRQQGPPVSRA